VVPPSFHVRVGVDILAVERVSRLLRENVGIEQEVFTVSELEYCARRARPDEHLAARFAAKEAVFKALGAANLSGQHWRDVEVRSDPHTGRSQVILHGRVKEAAAALGATNVFVSLSHTRDWAVASVVLEASDDRTDAHRS
jgi:holo-[acyl-carrier protein] synthase